MNAVEIEEAVSLLVNTPFDAAQFPYAFLEAFGNKEVAIKRLRQGNKSGGSNSSDVKNGVLQRLNIHLATCENGENGENNKNNLEETFKLLQQSPKTKSGKAKFILATDGHNFLAEELTSGDFLTGTYQELADRFGFFLPLAGIFTLREIKNNPIDIKATGRLNKLYLELLKDNKDWAKPENRPAMNHFLARLIFCFFAEDTDIFCGQGLFTKTIDEMSSPDGKNTAEIIEILFSAMNLPPEEKNAKNGKKPNKLPNWANAFPYVNGGLFSGSVKTPLFSRTARNYLLAAGNLEWREINPDIFGSMIQAVADDTERANIGMHYTSVPNILKVLNPLFLDHLRVQLHAAQKSPKKLQSLKNRLAKIRVFDPACGSGNFLVIAYKELRAIEHSVNTQLDPNKSQYQSASIIPLTNFRGIELLDFPAEIARLALIIAEFQCDVRYRGQKDALAEFLPLDKENWITCANALRVDWLALCPPTGNSVKLLADDLFNSPLEQAEIDFKNAGGETYICGNPPYLGSTWQSAEQKADLESVFARYSKSWKSLDYVAGWFMKAAEYGTKTQAAAAFVSTNSICQGQQVPILWPLIFATKHEIAFAHTSFKWANLASFNAGVTVVIVGISKQNENVKRLFTETKEEGLVIKEAANINAYLVAGQNIIVEKIPFPLAGTAEMLRGNMPYDGGHLLLSTAEVNALKLSPLQRSRFIRRIYGSAEFIRGLSRFCLWIEDKHLEEALTIEPIKKRIAGVRTMRLASRDKSAQEMAKRAHQMREINEGKVHTITVPSISSEEREYLPVGLLEAGAIISNRNYGIYDAPLWNMAFIASRLHWVWIGTVCARLEMRFSYANTLGWNTFPVPPLSEEDKIDLTRCAENILLAREAHFPATIADLYGQGKMPNNLRAAHEANDERIEQIYIGRAYKNDTERLEHLFTLYTEMSSKARYK